MPRTSTTPTTEQQLAYVRSLAHDLRLHEKWLRQDRAELRRRLAELLPVAGVDALVKATGLARPTVYRLARRHAGR